MKTKLEMMKAATVRVRRIRGNIRESPLGNKFQLLANSEVKRAQRGLLCGRAFTPSKKTVNCFDQLLHIRLWNISISTGRFSFLPTNFVSVAGIKDTRHAGSQDV